MGAAGRGRQGTRALARPSLVAWYVSLHVLTATAWHGGMALVFVPVCVCVCLLLDGTDGLAWLAKRDSGRERKRG